MKFESTESQVKEYLSKQVCPKDSKVFETLTSDITDYLELIWSEYYFEGTEFEKAVSCNMRKFITLLEDFNDIQSGIKLKDSLYSFALNYYREIEPGIEAFRKVYPTRVKNLKLKNGKLIIITNIPHEYNSVSFVAVDENLKVSPPQPGYIEALNYSGD